MGLTLNMLTILALTLSVGIVLDDAIVVLENSSAASGGSTSFQGLACWCCSAW